MVYYWLLIPVACHAAHLLPVIYIEQIQKNLKVYRFAGKRKKMVKQQ